MILIFNVILGNQKQESEYVSPQPGELKKERECERERALSFFFPQISHSHSHFCRAVVQSCGLLDTTIDSVANKFLHLATKGLSLLMNQIDL